MTDDLMSYYHRFKYREDTSYDLVKFRITEILLVSTFYDAFIFEQDGVLSEQLFGEYRQLNLSFPPRVTNVPTGRDALKALETRKFDLVITMTRTGDVSPYDLAARVKERHPDLPVLLLLNNQIDLVHLEANPQRLENFDDVFLWSGDSSVFLAMIKSVEDRRNLAHDTKNGLVRVILLIEDSVHHYSQFLPLLFSQVIRQTYQLISEEVTESYKRLRMGLRPKVILVHDFAEAEAFYKEYKDYLIAIVTDVQYERAGALDDLAGVRFITEVRRDRCTVPVLLQSADPANEVKARELQAHFIWKNSPHLLAELRDFITDQLGFGDFVFRTEDGWEIARASTMVEFMTLLRSVPDSSVVFHATNNHFSGWLIAHGEVAYAKQILPLQVRDFELVSQLRKLLIDVFDEVERSKSRGRVVDATRWDRAGREEIVRVREGSLGGKGRGLAFLNALVYALELHNRFPGVEIQVPATVIVGTSEYDEFLENNHIGPEICERTDEEIRDTFLAGDLSQELKDRLATFVERVHYPLAVRSSGLLEDSQSCPFAGVYKTFMLPNAGRDTPVRFEELLAAIKLVFACVFEEASRDYIQGAKFKVEEEKMAVVVQEIVGARHGDTYYPDVSGVAQSYNFYPTGPMRPVDGIATVALGLGKTVMEGRRVARFCPRYPLLESLAPEDLVRGSQKDFWAIQLDSPEYACLRGEEGTLSRLDLKAAEQHGTLAPVGSVWDFENERMVDGLSVPGPRVVTFANILKYGQFPLADILTVLLEVGEQAMGVPVEIEFAANVVPRPYVPPAFFLLQIRPLNVQHQDVEVGDRKLDGSGDAVVYTHEGLGNGESAGLTHVLYVRPERFSATATQEIREEIARLNAQMRAEEAGYVLIGPGRWGSRDRFLGVPVVWADISEARVIVEADLPEFQVEASQGTHFFHNLVARNVGYLKVRHNAPEQAFIDWDWIARQEVVAETDHCVLVRPATPLRARLDGKTGRAVVERAT